MNSTVLSRLGLLDTPDPQAKNYPLLGSHWYLTTILVAYLAIVLKLGRKFMENRKPYNLKYILIVYNIFQVIYNFIMFGYAVYYMLIKPQFDRRCIMSLSYDHPKKNVERMITYAYYINKIIDLLDTMFFILRKSYKQITALHVYHHVMMPFFVYWVVQLYGFGGQYSVIGFLNTFVHTVMYFYYLVTALYPVTKGSLWWKKYITKIQLLQFALLLLQSFHVLVFNPGCQFPMILQCLQIGNSSIMVVMFSNFYYHSYIKQKPQSEAKQK